MSNIDIIPEIGFLRLKQVLKIIPVGRSTWLAKVKSGEYPKPLKLTERTVCWRVEDIKSLIESINNEAKNESK
jgi:predicted DNA-binding transcriptional regulator AlpA